MSHYCTIVKAKGLSVEVARFAQRIEGWSKQPDVWQLIKLNDYSYRINSSSGTGWPHNIWSLLNEFPLLTFLTTIRYTGLVDDTMLSWVTYGARVVEGFEVSFFRYDEVQWPSNALTDLQTDALWSWHANLLMGDEVCPLHPILKQEGKKLHDFEEMFSG